MTAEQMRQYSRSYYQRKLKGSAKQKERNRKAWYKLKMRMMVDEDFYADYRRKARERKERWRRRHGMKVRGAQVARTIPDWCTMGHALDTRSPFLPENMSPELRAYGLELATEWAAKRRMSAR